MPYSKTERDATKDAVLKLASGTRAVRITTEEEGRAPRRRWWGLSDCLDRRLAEGSRLMAAGMKKRSFVYFNAASKDEANGLLDSELGYCFYGRRNVSA